MIGMEVQRTNPFRIEHNIVHNIAFNIERFKCIINMWNGYTFYIIYILRTPMYTDSKKAILGRYAK